MSIKPHSLIRTLRFCSFGLPKPFWKNPILGNVQFWKSLHVMSVESESDDDDLACTSHQQQHCGVYLFRLMSHLMHFAATQKKIFHAYLNLKAE